MKARAGIHQVKVTFCLIPLFLLGPVVSAHGRQLFYILDRIITQDGYINEIKCFDLNGVFQYKLFEVDPWEWYDYRRGLLEGIEPTHSVLVSAVSN